MDVAQPGAVYHVRLTNLLQWFGRTSPLPYSGLWIVGPGHLGDHLLDARAGAAGR